MDVDDTIVISAGEIGAEDGQKSGQHDQVDVVLFESSQQSLLKTLLGAAACLFGDRDGGDAGLCGPLQGIGAGFVGDYQSDLAVEDLAGRLGVDEGLQVGAAARNQYGDADLFRHKRPPLDYSSSIFSSPVTISPMT